MSGMQVDAETIGAGWLAVAAHILAEGADARYDAMRILELERVTLTPDLATMRDAVSRPVLHGAS